LQNSLRASRLLALRLGARPSGQTCKRQKGRGLKQSIIATAVLCALCAALAVEIEAPQEAHGTTARQQLRRPEDILQDTKAYRRQTWHWQQLMGVRKTPTRRTASASTDLAYRIWVRNVWHRRATQVRKRALHPPHKRQWQCIHRYEGDWRSNTGNGYYGGLQMDIAFQRHYGSWLLRRKGTADRWTPIEQMWVAERAHRSGRGFMPWPNTARACGLI
jgi:Transglycosylase-like domain